MFQMAEVAVSLQMFAGILMLIARYAFSAQGGRRTLLPRRPEEGQNLATTSEVRGMSDGM
jgi:hypothetical protein